MEPSAPPSDFLEVGIPVLLISTENFTTVDTYIDEDTWDIDFKIGNIDNEAILSISITLKCLIDDNKHAIHISKTIFQTKGLTFTHLQPGDNRLEILVELSLTALGHARSLFFTATRPYNIPPFIMVFTNEIRKVVAKKAKTLSH